MIEPETLDNGTLIACHVCMVEIPLSEAINEEALDYVMYFCGLECFDKWRLAAEKSGLESPCFFTMKQIIKI